MKIIKEDQTYAVYEDDGTLYCKGFMTIDMALKGIWVLDGSKSNLTLSQCNGYVLVESKR